MLLPSNKILLFLILSLLSLNCTYAKNDIKNNTKDDTKNVSIKTINNNWYVMQTGNTPWGIYHEVIEKKSDHYSYRYEMKKKERGKLYTENIGALAKFDLTPMSFNIVKSGDEATEIINGAYKTDHNSGLVVIDISGAKKAYIRRHLAAGTLFDVFVPIWLSQNWAKLKPKTKGQLRILSEDQRTTDFLVKIAKYEILNRDSEKNCLNIKISVDDMDSIWCLEESGAAVSIKINQQVQVNRVKNEQEAKDFLNLD